VEPFFWIIYTSGGLGPAISSYLIYRQFKRDFKEKFFNKCVFSGKINVLTGLIFLLLTAFHFFMVWFAFGIDKPISMLLMLSMLINFSFLILLGGLEELVWRGILQPKLEKVVHYLPSILLVGLIWSVWQLPLWMIEGTPQSTLPFGLYLIFGIVLSASFTACYKYTNNLFLTVVSHVWFNGCINLALDVGKNGVLQLDLNGEVIVVFAFEGIVSLFLGTAYTRRNFINIQN
jgi:membrane protease YdiL (CAAX protease family)